MEKEIYTTYAEDTDITFILEDTLENGKVIQTEVKGFYFGEPTHDNTMLYYGKLKAEFTM